MRRILLALLVVLLASPALAVAGKKLLVIRADHSTTADSQAPQIARVVNRWLHVTGNEADYDIISSRDSVWDAASSGAYDEAIYIGLPNLYYINTEAYAEARGVPQFTRFVNRNSSRAFPIRLIVPLTGSDRFDRKLAGVCGADSVGTTAPVSGYYPFVDEWGDSLFTYAIANGGGYAPRVFTGKDWCKPLIWRSGTEADTTVEAHAWMTVGSGEHSVVWVYNSEQDYMAHIWPAVLGLSHDIRPVELPIVSYQFGKISAPEWGVATDTTGYGSNLARVKNFGVAKGMKIDLLGLVKSMKRGGTTPSTVNSVTAYEYAQAWPNNFRITPQTYECWRAYGSYTDWLGTIGAAAGNTTRVARIQATQDSLDAYYPGISQTRANIYSGDFTAVTTNDDVDSILIALAKEGITDVQCVGHSEALVWPGGMSGVVQAQRAWIDVDGELKEMRFQTQAKNIRYWLQPSGTSYADSLRPCYVKTVLPHGDTTTYSERRAVFTGQIIPYCVGYYAATSPGSTVGINSTSALSLVAERLVQYSPGIQLNALALCGDMEDAYAAQPTQVPPEWSADSCLFMSVLQIVDNIVSMANHIIEHYGDANQSAFIYAWMEDVCYDRRGRHYPNDHVTMQ